MSMKSIGLRFCAVFFGFLGLVWATVLWDGELFVLLLGQTMSRVLAVVLVVAVALMWWDIRNKLRRLK